MPLLCIAPTGYNISFYLLNGIISINHDFRSSIHKASQQKLRVILCSPSFRLHSKISRGIELDIISKTCTIHLSHSALLQRSFKDLQNGSIHIDPVLVNIIK